jgi:hypothetical protein
MDAEQARELALNARLDYWPAHLGVNTDAERIEHLATKLDEAATRIAVLETFEDEAIALREEDVLIRSWYSDGVPEIDESAVKNPEQLPETQDEILLRKRAEQLYYQSGGGFSGFSKYAAGWLAAKAHYQPKQ